MFHGQEQQNILTLLFIVDDSIKLLSLKII
jgi:hypothetical protein